MDDLEFVQRCTKGDKRSWDEFVDRYSRLVYNYIHGVLRIKGYAFTQQIVQDLFQEIFLLLTKDNFKKLKTFQGRNNCSLASWLRQVTVNFTIDYIRKTKQMLSINEENDEGFSLEDILSDGSEPILDKISMQEKLVQLKDCIAGLNIEEKYFLELYLNLGLSLEAMRERFGVSRGAIDMRKTRIIEKLRKCFKLHGFTLDY